MAILLNRPEPISKDHYLLKIKNKGNPPVPGQFINIKVSSGTDPLIRRPFSIYNYKNGIIEIVIRVIGKGTKILSEFEEGDIDILTPLGNGFSMVDNKKVLLTGGGVGNAPLYFLGRELKKRGNHITTIYGASSKEYIYLKENFESISDSFSITTDDGTEGTKGYVTELVEKELDSKNFDIIYTCGPTIAMKKISLLAEKKMQVEVSMENYFGCGVGICSGCTIETINGFKRACVDGPVFNGKDIDWDKY